jgi:hypothetical protein
VNADPSLSAPAVASGKIKYASFTASKLFLVPSQGTVRAQSGNDAKIPFSLSFPSTNWSYVKNVVLQVSKDNEEWIAARTILASSMTSNDTTMSFDNKELVDLSGNAIVNGSKYRLRCHVVPNDIEEVSLPYNGDSGITNAVPFTVATISSSGLASAIDEVNNKITVDASWSIVPGTYSQIYDVYVNGQLSDNIQSLGSSLDVSETSAYLELSITGVADKFGLSYSSPKDAAQQLHNLSLYLVITPKINFNLFTGMNLSYPDHFELPMGGAATGSNNYLTYGSTSSSSANSSTVPGIPLGLSLSTLQVDRTGLQWNRASETSLNAAVDFQVIISRFSDFSDIPVVKIVSHNEDSSLLHSVDILDLPRNVVHYVKVVARNALGSSLDSSVLQFTTLPQVPSLGAITVEQLADDDLARISVDFTKLSSAQLTGYTLVRYEMCVLDHLNNQIGEVVEITSDTTLPIVFEGNFGSEYYFKVKAVLHNILNESFVSDVSYSQSVKIIDYPKIDSVVASNVSADNSSKLVIKVKPNGASEVNIIAFAISADASKASEVKTTKIPDLTGSNLNEYELNFPYLLDTNPKFLVLAANDRGSRYVLSGF